MGKWHVKERIKASQIRGKARAQNFRCAYTGDELTPDNTSADHIIPVSRGGAHTLDNICLVTDEANRMKGALTAEEFIALCRKVVAHADAQKVKVAGPRHSDREAEPTLFDAVA